MRLLAWMALLWLNLVVLFASLRDDELVLGAIAVVIADYWACRSLLSEP